MPLRAVPPRAVADGPRHGEPTRDVQKLAQRALRLSRVLCLAATASACLPPLRAVAATATDTKAAGVTIVVPAKRQVVAGPVLPKAVGWPRRGTWRRLWQ
jgi:hypothetical protein